jgi:cardiolipin synthase
VIRGARRTLLVSSFGFGHKEVMHALEARARAGVQVTVLTRPRPAIVDSVQQLSLAGAKVYGVPHLHGKALCADEERGLLMTANLDLPSMVHSFEVGVGQAGEDGAALSRALRGWEQSARWEFRAMADLRSLRGQRVMVSPDLRSENIIDVDHHLAHGARGESAQPGQTPRAPRKQVHKRGAQKGQRKKGR